MKTYRMRDAVMNDSIPIARIYAHYVETTCFTFEEVAPAPEEMAARMSKVKAAGLPWLIAEMEGGSMIGYAYASAFHPRSAYRYSLEDTVYIAPDHTGQGIGTALMKRLIDECTSLGYRQMVALIGDKHNGFSARLHEGLGFRPVGTLTAIGFKFGRWVDVDEMQLPLGDGAHSTPATDPLGRAP